MIREASSAARDGNALRRLVTTASVPLAGASTPIEEMSRLRTALRGGPQLLIKRDDAIPFGFGGNKVRKLEMIVSRAVATRADTLVTTGGVQSNHARATAAFAAKLGMKCVIVANGEPQERPTGNALLDELLGAEVEYVPTRADRTAGMEAVAARLRDEGRTPYLIPLGASTPLGALGIARAIGEMLEQGVTPDVIIHATASGGTQAGLVAGCALNGLRTRVIGVSADDPAPEIEKKVREIISGIGELLRADDKSLGASGPVLIDDGQVGDGYGLPTPASLEAQSLAARCEAIFVDHTYTAKALAALLEYVRDGRFMDRDKILFWHTGGQPAIFA
ncbi:MAG TPA: D-cysteine desulfhydrase family protein [Longimicrobiaceae bacterium]|nr:D-cysteine desulfhydrase family protein [Longimicrobiaceae bacterium]